MQTSERLAAAIAELAAAIAENSAPEPDQPDRLLSIIEAADTLGVGRTKVYDEIGSGRLRTLQVGRRRLVSTAALRDYIEQR